MTRGITDVFQIVVLAAGAHAALRTRRAYVRPFFRAEKHIFELHHAGIGEQQGGIIGRYQAAARHHFMAVIAKKLEKLAA